MVILTKSETRLLFARRLNELLDEAGAPVRGRSQWLARLFKEEFAYQSAQKWLNGEFTPEETHVDMLCAAFGWATEYLRTGRGPKYVLDEAATELLNNYRESSEEDQRSLVLRSRNARDLRQIRSPSSPKPRPPTRPTHPRKRRDQ